MEDLNRTLRGWDNFFCLGAVRRAYRAVTPDWESVRLSAFEVTGKAIDGFRKSVRGE